MMGHDMKPMLGRVATVPAAVFVATMLSGPTLAADSVKVGVLQSLSGTMAISEVTVKNAEMMAIDEINAAGGVLGKKIEPIVEDGASDPAIFAQKAAKLVQDGGVVAVFGGWTSASRKAMLPVFQRLKSLLWYPVQFEGNECSPNIMYSGAQAQSANRSRPGVGKREGLQKLLPHWLRLRVPPNREFDPQKTYRS